MSYRLLLATTLAISSSNLLAQPSIPSMVDTCFKQPSATAARGCLANEWDGSLRRQRDEMNAGFKKHSANLENQIKGLQGDFGRLRDEHGKLQTNYGKLQSDYNALVKNKPDIEAAVLANRGARRASAIAAIQDFTAFFKANAKDLDFVYWNDDAAGVVLVRRLGTEPSILLAFPSLSLAYLQPNGTQQELRLECLASAPNCIFVLSRDGGVGGSSSEGFPLSGKDATTLVDRARTAIGAFK